PLVDPLVTPTDEDETIEISSQLPGPPLVERPSLRTQQNDLAARHREALPNRFHPFKNGPRHQIHSAATPIGSVIHLTVPVVSVVSQVVQPHLDESLLLSPLQNSLRQRSSKHPREYGEHVKLHQSPGAPREGLSR